MPKINFTQEEAKILLALMDIAVKNEGLKIAQNALYLANKIETAFTEPELPVKEKAKEKKVKTKI